MEKSKTVEISGVGLVLFERSKRARRISISIRPFRGIRVAVPYASSFKKAEEFARTKKAWIKRHLENMKRYEGIYNNNPVNAGCIDKAEAKTTLVKRLKWLAGKYGFSYNRVFIRNQKTIWGSCSGKNNISLNMKLVQLSDELVDYVILHELAHTIKKDHSKAFWAEMDKLVGNGKKMSKRLKNYGMELY
jgi:hypothetical protein